MKCKKAEQNARLNVENIQGNVKYRVAFELNKQLTDIK